MFQHYLTLNEIESLKHLNNANALFEILFVYSSKFLSFIMFPLLINFSYMGFRVYVGAY